MAVKIYIVDWTLKPTDKTWEKSDKAFRDESKLQGNCYTLGEYVSDFNRYHRENRDCHMRIFDGIKEITEHRL